MRVVYVVSLFPCWSETFIVREIQELLRLGVDVRIVSLKHASEAMVQSDAQALLERVTYPVAGWRSLVRVLSHVLRHPLLELREHWRLFVGLRAHPDAWVKSVVVWWRTLGLLPVLQALAPDHLHAHWATYPSTAAMWAGRRLGLPYSFTAHAHDIFLEDHLLAAKLRSAAFGVTISEFNRRFLAQRVSPAASSFFRIVHCGVVPERFAFQPAGRTTRALLAVGRLDEIKGFMHLIDACAVLARRGVAFDCQIIGEGPLRTALEKRIVAVGLASQVHLLGALPQERVRELLALASVFVLPSVVTLRGDRDGIPVALMEAMAIGLPVVTTRVSGIPELVEHGVTGLLAEPEDPEALADGIQQVFDEPGASLAMATRARRKIEIDFDVSKESERLLQAFRDVKATFNSGASIASPDRPTAHAQGASS